MSIVSHVYKSTKRRLIDVNFLMSTEIYQIDINLLYVLININRKTSIIELCSYKCVLSIFIYTIALQNTDFGVLQKSSKHFLISIFFYLGRRDTPSLSHPRSALRASHKGFAKNVPPPPPCSVLRA